MPLKMRNEEKKQFLARARAEYARTRGRKAKGQLIDAVVQFVGYKCRKQAIRALNSKVPAPGKGKRGRVKKLDARQVEVLREIWFALDQPCGKRMQPVLGTWVSCWEKQHGALNPPMPAVSASTLDRVPGAFKLCKPAERDDRLQLASLKKSIPYVDRRKAVDTPGVLSADTVAHCGGDMSGDFAWTLTVTDELTGWTRTRAIWNKGQYATCCALGYILRHLPFRVRSINTDNGSEFINYHLQRFIKERLKTCKVTRSRPNRKNDNARVEERNLRMVRECVGYERLDDESFVRLLNRIYNASNLLANHFHTWQRVVSKERKGSKVIRHMDTPTTPYERLLGHLKEGGRKKRLQDFHESLDPWKLRKEMQEAMTALVRRLEAVRLGRRAGRPGAQGEACQTD